VEKNFYGSYCNLLKTIIICIPWFHPAYKAGGPIQSIANMVEQFHEKISYKIFCSNTDLDGTVLNVPVNNWVKYNENTQVWYTSQNKQSIAVLKKQIKNSNADIIFIIGIYSWYFNLAPLLLCKVSRKIVSVRGMLHPGALSQKSLKKTIYLFFGKLAGLHKKCSFHASTEEEKKFIENVFGKEVNVFVAQNFPRIIQQQTSSEKLSGYLQLISIALISPMKNHLLVLEALMACESNITYNIYGPVKDHAYWNICLEQIKKLPKNVIVKYYGDIPPQEVEIALSENHVFILPSKSENFGHAIYEALTAGKPVITSNNTPWNNLKASKAGINIEQNNPDELVNAINYFASMDQNEFEQWSNGANKYAANSINVDDIKQQYHKMFFA
jgi:glycosyltransferase involved in cell wall biosynthesis